MSAKKERVVIAMSGGVDSSVAAYLLLKQGFEVIGISMRLYSYEAEAVHGCCTPEDLYDARRVADQLGIPYYVSNFEAEFEKSVIEDFVSTYQRGETPNPCIRCNQDVKFRDLLKRTRELGAEYLATGHYARKVESEGKYKLLRGMDSRRDQSYFLFGLRQEDLKQLIFPLGDLPKEEVRVLAHEAGLNVAEKPDSQEICFVPEDYASFLERKLEAKDRVKGRILDQEGAVLGKHDGIHRFTVGQRRGLNLSLSSKRYVLAVHPEGDVVIGGNEALMRREFLIREMRWGAEESKEGTRIQAQIRSRFVPSPAMILGKEGEFLRVLFDKPQRAITPGQAAVLYDGDELLGGGWIHKVL